MLRNRLYYGIKPLLPPSVRLAVRRWFAVRKRAQMGDTWPILPGSERPPEGWRGWPEGKQFALVLTHDVEGPAGVSKCRQLMEIEKELGFRSSFNFIPEGDYRVTRELREELQQGGFEVGVHDLHHDGSLYRSRQDFRNRVARINHYLNEWGAVGFRAGFMFHNLEWLHELDIAYDASTFDTDPFEPQPDHVGTIFPFWVPAGQRTEGRGQKTDFRPQSSVLGPQSPGYVELPYTLPQDSTLFLVFDERHPDIWFQKLDWVARHGGMALVNVHPDYLRFPGEPPSRRTFPVECYRRMLEYVRHRYAGAFWHALPVEVARWYSGSRLPQKHEQQPEARLTAAALEKPRPLQQARSVLAGRRVAVLLFSEYSDDPRPRRAAQALVQMGMQVEVVCLRLNEGQPAREVIEGVEVTRAPYRHKRESKLRYALEYSTFLVSCFVLLAFRSLRQRYSLVHVHNMPDVLVFSALVPKLLGARVLLDLHDPMPELMMSIYGLPAEHWFVQLLRRFERWSIGFADKAVTPNIAFKNIFVARSCPPDKMHIVMNTPREDMFDPAQVPCTSAIAREGREVFRLMYHGCLVARHGLDLAVEAVHRIHHTIPRVELRIFGGQTPYIDEVLEQVDQMGLGDAIRYEGRKEHHEIPQLISECHLGIIPNRRSPFIDVNFPTRIFEYLAMGRPVIVPRTRGILDYFSDRDILFFAPDNAADLAEKIVWVHSHPEETAEIVRRGQAIYRAHLWSREQERLISLVAGLLRADPDQAEAPVQGEPVGGAVMPDRQSLYADPEDLVESIQEQNHR